MRILLAMAALLTLTSCASLGKDRAVFVPPKIDCAVFDPPRVNPPSLPGISDGVPAWQLYAWGWQAYSDDVLNQRVETAQCMAALREAGIIK